MSGWGAYFGDPENVKQLLMWFFGLYVTAYIVYTGMPTEVQGNLGFSPKTAAWFAFTALIGQAISLRSARTMDSPK